MAYGIRKWEVRAVIAILTLLSPRVLAGPEGVPGWVELIAEKGLDEWRAPTGEWLVAANARPDAASPARLTGEPGKGVLINGPTGKTRNLLSKQEFGDIEAHFEFLIPKGSNSGVKFQAVYEIQIIDSVKVGRPSGSDCGGIYPRAEMLPRYHHIDDGIAPRVNAARPWGEWQTLDVIFRAPRFDAGGKKVKNARFDKVVLNGQVIHEGVDVASPTGHVWRLPEKPRGPIMLQADHGPVAFRNIKVRPID